MQRGERGRLLVAVVAGALAVAGVNLFVPVAAWWLIPTLLLLQASVAAYLLRHAEEEAPPGAVLASLSSLDYTFRLGDETFAHLRHGLNEESAQKICEIIRKVTEMDAVAITDEKQILGFAGVGCHRHRQGGPILTDATRRVIEMGTTTIVTDPRILACDEQSCPHPLKSAVITPLKYRGQVIGTFKLYRTSPRPMPGYIARLAVSIAMLLGLQVESAEAERQRQQMTRARLEALQAQIHPHFLFNVLNTIILFSRTDIERSRDLLITLAQFFRRSLGQRGDFIPLREEVEYINAYLTLEKARFGEKLQVRIEIDPRLLAVTLPTLTLQPLVENAVIHGLAPREEGGVVRIRARRVGEEIHICIADNGVGMDQDQVRQLLQEGGSAMSVGFINVNERLTTLYGERYRLRLRSHPGRGTAVHVRVPIREKRKEAVELGAQNAHR